MTSEAKTLSNKLWATMARVWEKVELEDVETITKAHLYLDKVDDKINYLEKRIEALKNPKKVLGTFEVVSGQVMVSDPCYELNTWCQTKLDNVAIGTWTSFITKYDDGEWGIRVSNLVAYLGDTEPTEEEWKLVEGAHIGVDSGQAGIFDATVYRNNDSAPDTSFLSHSRQEEEGEKWYSHMCDLTLGTGDQAGVTTGGVVSSSGYGDGGYSLYSIIKDDKIVALKIVFIGDEDEEEEE